MKTQVLKEIKQGTALLTIVALMIIGLALIFSEPIEGEEISIVNLLVLKLVGFGSVVLSRFIYIKVFIKVKINHNET